MKTFSFLRLICITGITVLALSGKSQTISSLFFDGLTRNYIVKTPSGFTPSQSRPLVFNLHGYSSNASQQQFYSAMNAVADTAGFLVCYPDGVNNAWNSGWTGVYGSGIDDVGFISALIDTLHATYNIDLSRVYACGMSNGGFQSYRMACELENRICAFASVTGTFTDSVAFYCSPSRPIPIMEIHGTADSTVKYTGGPFYRGIEETIAFWVNHNQCIEAADTTEVPNTILADSSSARIISYTSCAPESEVVLIQISNGGHTWPGSPLDLTGLGYGFTNKEINASAEIWKFFNRFSLPTAVGITANEPTTAISVGPNPFQEFLSISLSEPADEIEILQANGQCILEKMPLKRAELQLKTRNWPAGVYFVKTTRNGQIITKKLMKL